MICSLFDGVALSGALSGGTRLGALAMMGLLLHLLPEGVLAATVTMAGGGSPRNARRAALAMGLAFLVGTTLPLVLGPLSASALPFSAGVLLYVALTELIPSVSTSGKGAGLVLAGSAGYFLLEQLAHRLV
ncbi:ZIP Zinc transporter [compost metagenome]